MKKSVFYKIFILPLLAIFIILNVSEISMASQMSRIVRVGYIDYNGFIELTENGYEGYAVDYLNEIAKHTNYRYMNFPAIALE
ncbi:MAG: hypothetical protein RR315_05340 [Oscillospiraceae bacterium]